MDKKEIVDAVKQLNELDPIISPRRHTWNFRRKSLRKTILDFGGDLSGFYHWPVVHDSLLTGATKDVRLEFVQLRSPYLEASVDPSLGGIKQIDADYIPIFETGSSGTYVRQAYVCQVISDIYGHPSKWESIFEFGGGFGALANVAKRVGFTGKHYIFDFPELNILQRWYHEALGVERIQYLSNFNENPGKDHYDIFVSICGIDEASEETRREILQQVDASFYFIEYSESFLGDSHNKPKEANKHWFRNYFRDCGYEVGYVDIVSPGKGVTIAKT